jgi:hypothetical protein
MGGAQDREERVHVVAVDGAHIGEAELVEERAVPHREVLDRVLGPAGALAQRRGQEAGGGLGGGAQVLEGLAGVKAGQIGDMAPTGGAIDISLSLRTTKRRVPRCPRCSSPRRPCPR